MDRTERQALLRAENIALAAKVKKSVLSKFMYSEGYRSVPYYEYYRDMFPKGELATWSASPKDQAETEWQYNGVLLMDTGKTKKIDTYDFMGNYIQIEKKTKSRAMIFDDLLAIDVAVNKALKEGKHSLLSPISYCGRSRAIESERFLYALIIEIDGLITKKVEGKRDKYQHGMKNILHQIKSNLYLSPSYIVCSGNIQKNRRNGRAQKEHLEIARCIQALQNKKNGTDWRDGSGRKPKHDVVRAWRAANPTGCKADCIRDTGLTKPTVYKWWDAPC